MATTSLQLSSAQHPNLSDQRLAVHSRLLQLLRHPLCLTLPDR
eukprot:CAMPEP_0202878166 /NCGR_PEP_ID=MMETSP1391-20130828/31763_1 /ASSEMBLY_ACC=CAM_ASM_000867 /TAXON_ID=1034604 /ORGANISM="Chlamydomonas leiostraca, Strain SAG 11-49" /LENGTH=42 /DNA_ID= /DNA_START= /DNA_END= /DNA_ORIENTATION=